MSGSGLGRDGIQHRFRGGARWTDKIGACPTAISRSPWSRRGSATPAPKRTRGASREQRSAVQRLSTMAGVAKMLVELSMLLTSHALLSQIAPVGTRGEFLSTGQHEPAKADPVK